MDAYKFLKPNGKLIIRDPNTKMPLSENGELKEYNSYWRRRVIEGSCIIVEQNNTVVKEEIIFDDKNNIIKKGGK